MANFVLVSSVMCEVKEKACCASDAEWLSNSTVHTKIERLSSPTVLSTVSIL